MPSPKPEDIEALIEIFNASDWDEMHLKVEGLELFLSNDPNAVRPGAAPAAAAAVAAAPAASAGLAPAAPVPATPAAPQDLPVPPGMEVVRAPNLGTFYRAPKPGAPTYVEIGQEVEADTEVCLIEVMKLFTPVQAGIKGIIRQVCIEDAQMVEFDQPLFFIEPTS
jgi:acetyl-CoA carboxylase biotin carboxyl carrier protein